MACQSLSMVRAAALRRMALSLAKASVRGSAPNRVEVGRVGRQVEQPGASRFDGGADRWAPVRGQVIHDHDIAAMQTGYQHLFDIGEEGDAGHRPVEHHRRAEPIAPQGGDKRGGFPVAERRFGEEPTAARRAAVKPGHLGAGAGLVDKDEPGGIDKRPCRLPDAAPGGVSGTLCKRSRVSSF